MPDKTPYDNLDCQACGEPPRRSEDRIWYDPSRRCLTVIRKDTPRSWSHVREATPEDLATMSYYGSEPPTNDVRGFTATEIIKDELT